MLRRWLLCRVWHEILPLLRKTVEADGHCGTEFGMNNDPSLADTVTHDELQRELQRLRAAVLLLASHVPHDIRHKSMKRLLNLCAPPHERYDETV